MAWGCQRPGPSPAPHSLLSHQTTQNARWAGMAMLLGGWVTRGKCQLGTQPQFLSPSHGGPTNGPLASCKVSAAPIANLTLLLLFLVLPCSCLTPPCLGWCGHPCLDFLGKTQICRFCSNNSPLNSQLSLSLSRPVVSLWTEGGRGIRDPLLEQKHPQPSLVGHPPKHTPAPHPPPMPAGPVQWAPKLCLPGTPCRPLPGPSHNRSHSDLRRGGSRSA